MSRGLNKIMLIGRVGTDPEMRYTPSGKPVTNFRLAVNRRRGRSDDQQQQQQQQNEETDWFTIVCWERLAEIADQYVTKGTQLYVEGRLQIRHYTNREGQEATAVDVVANDFQMLGSRADRERAAAGGGGGGRESGRDSEFDKFEKDDFDDVPF